MTTKPITANAIIERADALGYRARLWTAPGKVRIYADTDRRDMVVYLDIDGTADDVQGAALKVYCNTRQHARWIESQVAEYRRLFVGLIYAYVLTMYADTGPEPNGYGPDINAMIEQARNFEACYRAEHIGRGRRMT